MLLTRLLFVNLFLSPCIVLSSDNFKEYSPRLVYSPRQSLRVDKLILDYQTPQSPRTLAPLTNRTNTISISPRFKMIASDKKILTDYSGNGRSFYFGCFGLLDENIEFDQNKTNAPLLKISVNNNYKVKSFEGYVDKVTFTELYLARESKILDDFIINYKLPYYFKNTIINVPELKIQLERNIYRLRYAYFNELKTIFHDLNLQPQTKCVHVADHQKMTKIFLARSNSMIFQRQNANRKLPVSKSLLSQTDPALTKNYLIPPSADKIKELISLAQYNHNKCQTFLNEVKQFIIISGIDNMYFNYQEFPLQKQGIYMWEKIYEHINDHDKYKFLITILYNISPETSLKHEYCETVENLRLKILLTLRENNNDAYKTNENLQPKEDYIECKNQLIKKLEEEFRNT